MVRGDEWLGLGLGLGLGSAVVCGALEPNLDSDPNLVEDLLAFLVPLQLACLRQYRLGIGLHRIPMHPLW